MARRPADEAHLLDEYTRLLEQNPKSPLFLALARLYRRAGVRDRAEEMLRKGLEAQPQFAEARVALGMLLAESDRWEEARTELEEAAKLAPHNLSAQRLLARCYERNGDGERAALAADAASLLDPGESLAPAEEVPSGAEAPLVAAAVAAGEEKPLPAAPEEELEVGAGEPLPTEALAELYARQGHAAEAAGVYRKLLEKEPENLRFRARLEELEGQADGVELEVASAGEKEEAAPAAAPAGFDMGEDLESLLAGAGAGPLVEPAEAPLAPGGEREAPPLAGELEELTGERDLEAPPSLDLEAPEAVAPETVPISQDAEEGATPPGAPEAEGMGAPALEAEFERTVMALADLYLQDGLGDRALDLYKRAQSLHPGSPALLARKEALERELARVASGEAVAAAGPGDGELEGAEVVPLDAESRARVIGELERWLQILERRRAGNGGSAG